MLRPSRVRRKAGLIRHLPDLLLGGRPLVPYVREPRDDDARDPQWRPFDATRDEVEQRVPGVDYGMTYAKDPTAYYYWVKRG